MEIADFVLIIGAMKCGTTSLFQHLAQHPQIAPSSPKEIHYFSDDEKFARGREWYLNHWNWNPEIHKLAMEASPSYTTTPRQPNTAQRILEHGASFRFIYILREPIARIESHYAHEVKAGKIRSLGDELPQHWIDRSKYAMQLGEYTSRFSEKQILVLDFDELRLSPEALLRRVCRFLGLAEDVDFKGLDTAHNVSRKDHPLVKYLWGNSIARAVAKRVPIPVKQRIRNALSSELELKPRLTPGQRRFATQALADDVRTLHEEYGFDTSHWPLHPVP